MPISVLKEKLKLRVSQQRLKKEMKIYFVYLFLLYTVLLVIIRDGYGRDFLHTSGFVTQSTYGHPIRVPFYQVSPDFREVFGQGPTVNSLKDISNIEIWQYYVWTHLTLNWCKEGNQNVCINNILGSQSRGLMTENCVPFTGYKNESFSMYCRKNTFSNCFESKFSNYLNGDVVSNTSFAYNLLLAQNLSKPICMQTYGIGLLKDCEYAQPFNSAAWQGFRVRNAKDLLLLKYDMQSTQHTLVDRLTRNLVLSVDTLNGGTERVGVQILQTEFPLGGGSKSEGGIFA